MHAGASGSCASQSSAETVQSNFRIDVEQTEGATILRLVGELDLSTAPQLEREFTEQSARQPSLIVLDLRELQFMDSTGLRALLLAHETARTAGFRFGVVKGPRQVQRLLSLTRVADRLVIADEPDELLVAS
jgi:anti-anti-sigma factor